MQIPSHEKVYERLVLAEQEIAILRLKVVELSKPEKKNATGSKQAKTKAKK